MKSYSKKEEIKMVYKQMRLPIEKITPEFEEELKDMIKNNYLQPKIREATEEDLKILVNLYKRAWITSNTPFSSLSLDVWNSIYKDPRTKIFIAKVYGTDAGFIVLDIDGNIGVIIALGVIPRFQHRGLGKILGIHAWNYFKEMELKELKSEVYIENHLSYKFTKDMGFEEFGNINYIIETLT